MMVSSRGRYALRVLINLAQSGTNEFVPLKDITEREGISKKYLESIMTLLSKNNMVEGVHGKGGGYRLNRPAGDYTVGMILRLTEGDLSTVACLAPEAEVCQRAEICKTLPVWKGLTKVVNDYLDSVTIEDLLNGSVKIPE
ncbi:MAG: RrF2 family transcriptional regulator [Lachnospiraceae bacterium]